MADATLKTFPSAFPTQHCVLLTGWLVHSGRWRVSCAGAEALTACWLWRVQHLGKHWLCSDCPVSLCR